MAYGDSQVRSQIGAVTPGLPATYPTAQDNTRSLTHRARPGIEPVSSDISQILFHRTTTGTPDPSSDLKLTSVTTWEPLLPVLTWLSLLDFSSLWPSPTTQPHFSLQSFLCPAACRLGLGHLTFPTPSASARPGSCSGKIRVPGEHLPPPGTLIPWRGEEQTLTIPGPGEQQRTEQGQGR